VLVAESRAAGEHPALRGPGCPATCSGLSERACATCWCRAARRVVAIDRGGSIRTRLLD